MGNRAVITTAPFHNSNLGIYLHWNGGRSSVEGFLQACKELGLRNPIGDPDYGFAYMCAVIAVFFDFTGTSLGVNKVKNLDIDNGNNGTYLIDAKWNIVGRMNCDESREQIEPGQAEVICKLIVGKVNAAKAYKGEEEPKKKRTKKAAKV